MGGIFCNLGYVICYFSKFGILCDCVLKQLQVKPGGDITIPGLRALKGSREGQLINSQEPDHLPYAFNILSGPVGYRKSQGQYVVCGWESKIIFIYFIFMDFLGFAQTCTQIRTSQLTKLKSTYSLGFIKSNNN